MRLRIGERWQRIFEVAFLGFLFGHVTCTWGINLPRTKFENVNDTVKNNQLEFPR